MSKATEQTSFLSTKLYIPHAQPDAVQRPHLTEKLLAVEIGAIAITGLIFLFLLISGGLLSIEKPVPAVIRTIHQMAPLLALYSTAATFYFLASGK